MKENKSKGYPGQEFNNRIPVGYRFVAGSASSSEEEIAEERYQLIPAQLLSTGRTVGPFQSYRFAPGQAIDDHI